MNTRDQRKHRPIPFGKYTLLERIGSGGMAEIYRAKMFGAHGFEKELAVKKILPHLTDDKEFVEMFIDEAKIMVGLVHGNIVQVYDLGEIEGQYFIGMEFVHGKDLLDVLARCAEQQLKLPLKLALLIVVESLKGLDYAHKATDPYGRPLGLIHRDVSPSNILLSYTGDVKIGDFGVAKAANQRNLTEAGTLKGKVGYMSPEQVKGDPIDHRSDLFSVGIMLFEILNMRRLFIGGSDLDIMLRVRDIDVDRELQQCISLPPDLRNILVRALARLPSQRYSSAMELHDDLVDFLFRHRIRVTTGDLARFMERLFSKEIQQERERRQARRPITAFPAAPPPPGSAAASSASAPHDNRMRYRDRAGVVHGPMDAPALIALLAASPAPADGEWVAQGTGPWIRLQDMPELYEAVSARRMPAPAYAPHAPQASAVSPYPPPAYAPPAYPPAASAAPPASSASGAASASYAPPSKRSLGASGGLPTLRPASLPPSAALSSSSLPQAPATSPLSISAAPFSAPTARPVFEDSGSFVGSALGVIPQDPPPAQPTRQGVIGDLEPLAFGGLLMQLLRERATGRLKITCGTRCKELQLKKGNPVEVSSNNDAELLGNFLIREGVVTQTQVHRALQRARRFGGRLGDALVADRVILSHVLYQYLFRQAKAKIFDVFTWPQSDYAFTPQDIAEPTNFPLGLETLSLIIEGIRAHTPTASLEAFFERHGRRVLRRTLSPPVHMDALRLSARELRIATALDSRNVQQLALQLNPSRVQPEEIYRLAFLLLQLDLIHFATG
jgi:serine/threonine protein kinase